MHVNHKRIIPEQTPAGGVAHGTVHAARWQRTQPHPPLRPRLPVLQQPLCGLFEKPQDTDQHDTERRPFGERCGGKSQRHTKFPKKSVH